MNNQYYCATLIVIILASLIALVESSLCNLNRIKCDIISTDASITEDCETPDYKIHWQLYKATKYYCCLQDIGDVKKTTCYEIDLAEAVSNNVRSKFLDMSSTLGTITTRVDNVPKRTWLEKDRVEAEKLNEKNVDSILKLKARPRWFIKKVEGISQEVIKCHNSLNTMSDGDALVLMQSATCQKAAKLEWARDENWFITHMYNMLAIVRNYCYKDTIKMVSSKDWVDVFGKVNNEDRTKYYTAHKDEMNKWFKDTTKLESKCIKSALRLEQAEIRTRLGNANRDIGRVGMAFSGIAIAGVATSAASAGVGVAVAACVSAVEKITLTIMKNNLQVNTHRNEIVLSWIETILSIDELEEKLQELITNLNTGLKLDLPKDQKTNIQEIITAVGTTKDRYPEVIVELKSMLERYIDYYLESIAKTKKTGLANFIDKCCQDDKCTTASSLLGMKVEYENYENDLEFMDAIEKTAAATGK
jgi:hypothetical protein